MSPLIEEEKNRESFADGSAYYVHQKQTAASLQHFSGATIKDTGTKVSSQWEELWAVHMAVQFPWKEK